MAGVDILSIAAGIGGAVAALWTAYNANAARKNSAENNLLSSSLALVQTLQTEIARLNAENSKQREELDGVHRELDRIRRRTAHNTKEIRDIKDTKENP